MTSREVTTGRHTGMMPMFPLAVEMIKILVAITPAAIERGVLQDAINRVFYRALRRSRLRININAVFATELREEAYVLTNNYSVPFRFVR
jgi:hypothetical protein